MHNIIRGRAVPSSAGGHRDLINPATATVHGRATESGPTDVDDAVGAAQEAFASWRLTTPADRSALMLRAADILESHIEELTDLEVTDTGKPRDATRDEEIPASIDVVRFFAGACRVPEGRSTAEYLDGITSGIRREPVGVCGQIAPWNYPFMMAVWKWAPAVAAGNTVVLKPSELTPSSTSRMAELLADVLPPGVLNVVCGGPDVGAAIAAHPGVAMVSLTGSPRAGRAVAHAAADRFARVHLELGGNAPVIVFDDADLDATVEQVAFAAYYNAGQDCTAASRVLAHQTVYDDVVARLAEAARTTATGPLISAAQRDRVVALLATAPPHAKLVAGGGVPDRDGFYLEPTVVAGLRQDDELVQSEIFGPVITVQSFRTDDDALAMANGVEQGLTASVWTRSHSRALPFLRDLDFGAVSVNSHAPMGSELPHGGFGSSGYGKDLGIYGLDDYTRVKHIAHAW
ncbi:aldehyde dehydrogenase family protein [Mycolicibacterium agri]|uniref:aldehyde dehydrogenase family protein n=1 Tax=Mycolicibacterium agri TaxID=36811 RepID=UPI003530E49A